MNRCALSIAALVTLAAFFPPILAAEKSSILNLQLANLDTECTAFSPDGQLFAVAFDNQLDGINYKYRALPPTKHFPQERGIGIWNVSTGEMVHWLNVTPHGTTPACVRFSPDGKSIGAVGIDHESLFLWNLNTLEPQKIELGEPGHSIGYRFEFLNGGHDIAVTDSVGRITVIEIASQDILNEFEGNGQYDSLLLLRGGSHLASGFRVWSLDKDKLVREYDPRSKERRLIPYAKPDVVVVSPRSDLLFGMQTYASTPSFHTWRLAENTIAHPFGVALLSLSESKPLIPASVPPGQRGVGELTDLAISKSGHLLATSGLDRKARLWHIPTQTQIATFESAPMIPRELDFLGPNGSGMHDVEFSPDGKHLMTLCRDGDINFWEIERLDTVAPPTSPLHLTRYWIGSTQIEEARTEPKHVEPTNLRPSASDVEPGAQLLARNIDDKWYHARVTKTLPQGKVRVHFTGHSVRLDTNATRSKLRLLK